VNSREDRALLRRFEPVIRYTRGERFFPLDVDAYVRESSLWVQRPGEEPECLVPEGRLSLEKLGQPRTGPFGSVYYLKFIEPMNLADLAAYRIREIREQAKRPHSARFRAGRGRLARVGYLSRLVDALFSITLLARGRISGDTAAAAAMTYQRIMAHQERYVYYGRVVRQGRWTALQYWFFYPFNSWRSGFFGVNDHEADWEMVCVYLCSDNGGELQPAWTAYTSHDFAGDDLRRRWDDPTLEKVDDTHPVVYAGAGSHAGYYERGEYLTEIEIPFLAPVVRVANRVREIWERLLRQAGHPGPGGGAITFRVPFVDYARGDGLSIGPGGDRAWEEPRLLDPLPDWAQHYRGLWGVYVRDPISGENAPAGPLYNRDGSMRRTWYDPVGWAGLDKVAPLPDVLNRLRQQQEELEERCATARAEIAQQSQRLLGLGVRLDALREQPHLESSYAETRAEVKALSARIAGLHEQIATDETVLAALVLHAERIQAGELLPPDAHLRHPHRPASPTELRLGRLAEGWAAVSVGLMMMSIVALVILARHYLVIGAAAMIGLVLVIEAGFRRRLRQFITRVTAVLALASAVIMLYEFFWTIVVVAVLLAGAYLMVENVRELLKR